MLHWVSPPPTFPRGVIGNTAVFGTAVLGSNPGGEADFIEMSHENPVREGGDELRWFFPCYLQNTHVPY